MKTMSPQQLELFASLASERPPPAPADLCCLDCRRVGEYYMLQDAVWSKANPADDGFLSLACVETRLGRPLVRTDFAITPAEMANRLHSHWSQEPRS
jgi:hypothetical protein